MVRRRIFNIALILTLFFCSVSEAVNLNKAIIGKWVHERKINFLGVQEEKIDFLKDGTVILVISDDSQVGSYKFIDDGRLKIKGLTGALGTLGSSVYEVAISEEGTLILIDPAGKASEFFPKARWEKMKEVRDNIKGRGKLGINFRSGKSQKGRVAAIMPDGPAKVAGVRVGDIVLEINGQKLNGDALHDVMLCTGELGSKAELLILRGEERLKVIVTRGNPDYRSF